MVGFSGVRGWILVAAVCGVAAGASAVRAFQPTGPAVGTGANPLKTIAMQVPLTLVKQMAAGSGAGKWMGSAKVLEVPQGQTFVVREWRTTDEVSASAVAFPESLPCPSIPVSCLLVDGSVWTCGNTSVATEVGWAVGSGAKIELRMMTGLIEADKYKTCVVPVVLTGYFMRN